MGARGKPGRSTRAFSLMEVMIAVAVLFMVTFSILALVARTLRGATVFNLQRPPASMLAAMVASTNKMSETVAEGRFEDIAPGLYPGYRYMWVSTLVETGGLWRIDFFVAPVSAPFKQQPDLSILTWIPQSGPRGPMGGLIPGRPR